MERTPLTINLIHWAFVVCLCPWGSAFGQLDPQPLPVTKGVYRLPYADGTTVRFSNNHLNHPTTLNRVDMTGQPSGATYTVVSAAAGWVRIIQENNFTTCPDACGPGNDCDGDGNPDNATAQATACGSYSGTATVCCERHVEANGGSCPGAGTCQNGPNNHVWMEHANGEWTKYTHLQTGSVGPGGMGRTVDEFIPAGTPLGLQGDIGIASGPHVHFEAAVLNYVELPPDNVAEIDPDFIPATVTEWFTTSGFLVSDNIQDDVIFEDTDNDGANDPDDDVNRQDRIAIFCQVGFPVPADQFTAGPCDDACNFADAFTFGTINVADSPFYEQVSGTLGNGADDLIIKANAGAALRAGVSITLSPGFHAETDSFFVASIGGCDTPGGTGE